MADALVERLRAACAGEVREGVALATCTTLRVGGPARVLVEAERAEDLAAVGAAARDEGLRVLVVGRGSNMLVADAGWPGVAVVLGRGFRGVETDVVGDEGTVTAGAAEPMPALAARVADAGLGGFAWAAGVPGTLGGSVRMNAGAHGGEMVDHLEEVDLLRLSSGTRETWPAALLGLSYRSSSLPDDAVVVRATLRLPTASPDEVREEIRGVRDWRREHQPINEPNCGSVFTNPPGDSAGRLVDAAGLKGLRRGSAAVSDKHANFIVNDGRATAADLESLIGHVQATVERVHGVRLVPEVRVIGEAA